VSWQRQGSFNPTPVGHGQGRRALGAPSVPGLRPCRPGQTEIERASAWQLSSAVQRRVNTSALHENRKWRRRHAQTPALRPTQASGRIFRGPLPPCESRRSREACSRRPARDDRRVLAPAPEARNPVRSGKHSREPVPCNDERSPERFRTARAVQRGHAVAPTCTSGLPAVWSRRGDAGAHTVGRATGMGCWRARSFRSRVWSRPRAGPRSRPGGR
jgi:hypothetical protein